MQARVESHQEFILAGALFSCSVIVESEPTYTQKIKMVALIE